jgi:hypothetical protein
MALKFMVLIGSMAKLFVKAMNLQILHRYGKYIYGPLHLHFSSLAINTASTVVNIGKPIKMQVPSK